MRKPSPKLALRKETVRALATIDLSRVVGGQESDATERAQSSPKQCGAAPAAAPPG
jgi:hypothetical protein